MQLVHEQLHCQVRPQLGKLRHRREYKKAAEGTGHRGGRDAGGIRNFLDASGGACLSLLSCDRLNPIASVVVGPISPRPFTLYPYDAPLTYG